MKISMIPLILGQLGQRILDIMTAGDRILPLDRYDVDTSAFTPKGWAPLYEITVKSDRPKKIEKSHVVNI